MDIKLASDLAMWLNDGPGVVPATRDQLDELMSFDPVLRGRAERDGALAVRDDLASLVVRFLEVGDRWPRHGDSVDIDAFQAEVERAANARGWHVVSRDGVHHLFKAASGS